MHDSETFESSLEPAVGYESPRVEDVDLRAGTAETASAVVPISETG